MTEHCPKLVRPIEDGDMVVVGSLLPVSGNFVGLGTPHQNAIELAMEEFNAAGGLPGGKRIALLACDSGGNSDQGLEVAKHLVETVGVPVIIGPAFSPVFIDVTTQLTSRSGVMTISPSANSPTISGIEDNGLGWRSAASSLVQAKAMADLVRARKFQKVIALAKDDSYGRALIDYVGQEVFTDLGEDNFFSRTYGAAGSGAPDYATLVSAGLSKLPDADAVLLLGRNETAGIVPFFETALAETSTAVSVKYIFSDAAKAPALLELVTGNEALLGRVEGTETDHRNAEHYSAFSLRYQNKYSAVPGVYASNAYDAMYLVAYGMSSLGVDGVIIGDSLAAAMANLVEGRKFVAGPSAVNEARTALAAGEKIDFEGASGPLDFDLKTGEAKSSVDRWIVEKRANGEFRFINEGSYNDTGRGVEDWELPQN